MTDQFHFTMCTLSYRYLKWKFFLSENTNTDDANDDKMIEEWSTCLPKRIGSDHLCCSANNEGTVAVKSKWRTWRKGELVGCSDWFWTWSATCVNTDQHPMIQEMTLVRNNEFPLVLFSPGNFENPTQQVWVHHPRPSFFSGLAWHSLRTSY